MHLSSSSSDRKGSVVAQLVEENNSSLHETEIKSDDQFLEVLSVEQSNASLVVNETVEDTVRSIYSYNLSQEYDAGMGTCMAKSYVSLMAMNQTCGLEIEDGDSDIVFDGHRRVSCKPRKFIPQNITVEILNNSELLSFLALKQEGYIGRCIVVLFYTPYCVFSARIAPQYNALARLFPNLFILAVDASTFHTLNSKYGTASVPNIVIFHNGRALSRFNQTERTIEQLAGFVANVTGMKPNGTISVHEEDYTGPLSSIPEERTDYILFCSYLFLISFCIFGFSKSTYMQKLKEGLSYKGRNIIT